jgi:ComF family protein
MTLCERCGETLEMDGLRFVASQRPTEGLLCAPCRRVPPAFERAVAYGAYEDELRGMVHLLKYEGLSQIARLLGRRLAVTIAMLDGAAAKELTVIAVPLYPAKERARGFNQSVLIAEVAVAELRRGDAAWKLRLERSALKRVRDTESQFALSPKERRENLRGAFAVTNSAAIRNREVLLVDDIYTTGATARECARVLRQAGAAKVWVATVSRAQPEMVEMWSSS